MQVKQRLLQRVKAGNPHLGRREGVHPRNHADTALRRVCLQEELTDRLGSGDNWLEDNLDRNRFRGLERGRDRLGMVGDPAERIIAVKLLAAGDEPNFESTKRLRHQSLSPVLISWCCENVIVHISLAGGE